MSCGSFPQVALKLNNMEYNLEGYKSFDEWCKANRERVLEEDNIRRRMMQKSAIAENIDYVIEQNEQDELEGH